MKRPSPGGARAVWLAAVVLGLAGCGKSSDITGTGAAAQQTADDGAVQVGAAASTGNGGLLSEMNGTSEAVPMSSPATSPERAASADTTFTRGNLTITLSRTFYDAGGTALQQWDPSAVRAVVDSWIRGTVTGLRYQATVGRTGELDIGGLAAGMDTLTFDGTATDTTDARYTSLDGTRTLDVHALATRVLAAVKKLKDRNVNPWPLSGTATWNLAVDKYASGPTGGIEAHWDIVAVLTFNGTRTAELAINGRFHYHLDLLTGDVTRA